MSWYINDIVIRKDYKIFQILQEKNISRLNTKTEGKTWNLQSEQSAINIMATHFNDIGLLSKIWNDEWRGR